MKKILSGIIGFVFIAFSSCTSINPSYGLVSFGQTSTDSQNTLEGKMTYETFVVVPLGMSLASDDDMGLKIGRIKRNDEIIAYYFRAEVHSIDWIFAESIRIKIDDETYRLVDNSPNRQVQSGQYVIEILSFNITPDMLEKIKNAKTFTAELHRRVVTITDVQLERVKAFIQ